MAVVHEFNDTYKVYDWNVYIINDKPVDLEMVILVSKGYSEDKKTATFRKKIEVLPAKSLFENRDASRGRFVYKQCV